MRDYFNCNSCDKSIKINCKKEHLKSQYHRSLIMSIISRYSVTYPGFLHIEKILKNYVLEYYKKIEFYLIICKWKLHFSDTIVIVKSNTWYSVSAGYHLKNFLLTKIKYFERYGRNFSHISEMNITFISDLRNMTNEHYLNQPKSMLEWNFNAILAKNPEHIKVLRNSSHPLFRKYQPFNEDYGES